MPFRLLAITQESHDPCTRYRLNLYRPHLAGAGVEVEPVVWPVDEALRRDIVASAREFDGVLVQRRLLPVRHVWTLRKAARRLAYDFDDAVTYQDSAGKRPWLLLDKFWQFRELTACCDAVTAGNAYLADLAAAHVPQRRVHVVPTVLDLTRYCVAGGADSANPGAAKVLGWIGQRSTLPYLAALGPALRRLSLRWPELTLRCIGDGIREMPGVRIDPRRWSEAGEVAELRALDIGLAPLPNDVWTRGKCGLRLLQYLAAGVPAVASPVGTQRDIIAAGAALSARNGLEWFEQIGRLLSDAALRARMAAQGRALVRSRYVSEAWTETILAAWCGTGN